MNKPLCLQRDYFIKMKVVITLVFLCFAVCALAQYRKDLIQTDVVLNDKRKHFADYLTHDEIEKTFTQPLDSNSEYLYESACLAASQFMIRNERVKAGFDSLFLHYDSLQFDTKHALLEAVYGLYPHDYLLAVEALLRKEKSPKLFAMQAVYLCNNDASPQQTKRLLTQLKTSFPVAYTEPVLQSLQAFLTTEIAAKNIATPSLSSLFAYQKIIGKPMIYSLQRWNRDYPGLAIIQNGDGSFARDSVGRLLVFQQLARSASNLPYFITGGNTPQGIYSVQGTGISHNHLIGPTPNLQLLLPHENDAAYWHGMPDSSLSFYQNYLLLMPPDWRPYLPAQEALEAGTAGRTAIIAHGSTIDPDYFKDQPFFPLTPTLGCLCAKEDWNIFTGKLNQSDQLNFINTYLATPDEDAGYLWVININNKPAPVTREDVEKIVNEYEKKK